jgi:hypothetical protein
MRGQQRKDADMKLWSTSPVRDSLFLNLITILEENCSWYKEHDGCDGCPTREHCQLLFDRLSDKSSRHNLSSREMEKALTRMHRLNIP